MPFLHEEGSADLATTDVAEAVTGVDLVVLAMPVEAMAEIVERFPVFPAENSVLVTDVGSVKAAVVESVAGKVSEHHAVFVGSHPMAGSEKTGLRHAAADLFEGAPVILTPSDGGEQADAARDLAAFWETLGARTSVMSPGEHDRVVAAVSHLPHLAAAAIVNAALSGRGEAAGMAGGGFRDTTRVAAGSPDLWTGILEANRGPVLAELARLQAELEKCRTSLEELDTGGLRRFLSRAAELRSSIQSTPRASE